MEGPRQPEGATQTSAVLGALRVRLETGAANLLRVLKSRYSAEHLAYFLADWLNRAIAINSVIVCRIMAMTLMAR